MSAATPQEQILGIVNNHWQSCCVGAGEWLQYKCRRGEREHRLRLWRHAVPVARIKAGFSHVREPEDLSRKPLQADRQAAVRWHPGVEHPEVILERCRFQAARPQRIFEVLALVKPLPTRRNLEPVEEQVET